jgi:hypothetical protein
VERTRPLCPALHDLAWDKTRTALVESRPCRDSTLAPPEALPFDSTCSVKNSVRMKHRRARGSVVG